MNSLATFDTRSKSKKIDIDKEIKLIQKSSKSTCRCHHPTFAGGRCHYRTCRHTIANHLGYGSEYSDPDNKIIKHNAEVEEAEKYLEENDVRCSCGRRFVPLDLSQIQYEDPEPWTFAHCSKCLYDLDVWKFKNRVWRNET